MTNFNVIKIFVESSEHFVVEWISFIEFTPHAASSNYIMLTVIAIRNKNLEKFF